MWRKEKMKKQKTRQKFSEELRVFGRAHLFFTTPRHRQPVLRSMRKLGFYFLDLVCFYMMKSANKRLPQTLNNLIQKDKQ